MLKTRKVYYLVYSLIFAFIAFFGIYLFFLQDGLTIFKSWDTYDQQYMAFLRIGKWMRTIIREGKIQVWSPSIGYGADFFLSLSPYIMDPFNWISVVIPSAWAEIAFTIILFLKAWLAGITFSLFAFRRKHESYAILCGALCYAISGTAFLCLYQSQFFMPMILFPLVIMGADRLFEDRNPIMYILTLAWSGLNSFYHTYMIAIMLVGYVSLRWLFQSKEVKTRRRFFQTFSLFFLYAILAAGIAAISLLPMAKLMASMNRIELMHEVPGLYTIDYYLEILQGLLVTIPVGADAYIGFSAIMIASLFLLFIIKNKKLNRIKIELILLVIILCFPVLGYVLNGFGYVTNRWVWALTFLLAYLVSILLPESRKTNIRQCFLLLLLASVYIVIVLFPAKGLNIYLYPWICGLLLLSSIFIATGGFLKEKWFQRIAVLLTIASVTVFSISRFSDASTRTDYIHAGNLYERTVSSGGMFLLDEIDVSDGSRYMQVEIGNVRNASWLYEDVSGINFYMSFYNDRIDQFHNSIALLTGPSPFMYRDLNNRSELLAVLGVNHLFTKSNAKKHIRAIGYTFKEMEKNGVASWTRDASIVSLFDHSISKNEFMSYTPIQRQQILLQTIVLEKPNLEDVSFHPVLTEQELSYSISISPETIIISETEILITEEDQELILWFPEQSDGELYLFFDNIFFENDRTGDAYIISSAWKDQTKVLSQKIRLNTSWSHMYGGKHQWLINLGRIPSYVNSIHILFSTKGRYTWNGIHAYVYHTENVFMNIERLCHDNTSVLAENNQYRIITDLESKKYLLLVVPYSEGWKAIDNGIAVEILNADIGFMGLELEPGRHEIVFFYQTPGLFLGLIISSLSICIFIWVIVRDRKRHLILQGKNQT